MVIPRRIGKLTLLLTLGAVLTACPGGGGGGGWVYDSVMGVRIDEGDQEIAVGTSTLLTAHVDITGNASTAVTWASDDPAVAQVTSTGAATATVIGASVGTALISATSAGDTTKSATVTVQVGPAVTRLRDVWTDAVAANEVRGVGSFGLSSFFVVFNSDSIAGGNGAMDVAVRKYTVNGSSATSDWSVGLGTSADDIGVRLAHSPFADSVYVVGYTKGGLSGGNTGGRDAFVVRLAGNGSIGWVRQFGTAGDDEATDVAIDSFGQSIYVAGLTDGDLSGPNTTGFGRGFLRAYDSTGDVKWTRQFGSAVTGFASAVALRSGQVFVLSVGEPQGAVVRSFTTGGALLWEAEFDVGNVKPDVAVNDYVYVAGGSDGKAFVRSYTLDGTLRWVKWFGSGSYTVAQGVVATSDSVVVVGTTTGSLDGPNLGGGDAFIREYRNDGTLLAARQFGTSLDDYAIDADLVDGGFAVVGALNARNGASSTGFIKLFRE